jgi:hypothetical protein
MIFSSYNEEKSERFTGRILLELMYNQRLKNDFGELIPERKRPAMGDFSVNVPGHGGKTIGVLAVSMGQYPCGFVHGASRPDYVRLDDIQNRRRVRSRNFVRESIEWIMQNLISALAENYSCVIAAAPLNTQCAACTLEKGTEEISAIKTLKFPAEVRGKPAWREAFPESRRARIKKTIGSLAYNQEYMLIPIALDERIFKEESIKYYAPEEIADIFFAYIFSWTAPA